MDLRPSKRSDSDCREHWPEQSGWEAAAFYRTALAVLQQTGIPFLVGGGYAIYVHTGIARMTKDFDIFLKRPDVDRALTALSDAGYRTEVPYPHWLAKAFEGDEFVDIIFSSGNGLCPVDERWFKHAVERTVMGLAVAICPPEEMIWQKAFIQERERYDGADVAHLIKSCGPSLDWQRLLERFGAHWPVLYSHLVLFRYVYADAAAVIPEWVLAELTNRLDAQRLEPPAGRICNGTFLSREQYRFDIECWGYADPRLTPLGSITPAEIARWQPD